MVVLALLAGGVLGFGLVASPAASAYSGSAVQPGNIDSFESALLHDTPNTVNIPGGPSINDPRGTDFWEKEHRPIPGQTSSDEMWRDFSRFQQRAGLLPRLTTALGNIALAAGTFTLGYQIGTELYQLFHLPGSTPSTPEVYGACATSVYERGDRMVAGADLATSTYAPGLVYALKYKLGTGSCAVAPTIVRGEVGNINPTPYTVTRTASVEQPDWAQDPQPQLELRWYLDDPYVCGWDRILAGPSNMRWVASRTTDAYVTGCGGTGTTYRNTVTVAPPEHGDGEIKHGRALQDGGADQVINAPTTWTGKPTTKAQLDDGVRKACDKEPRPCIAFSQYLDSGISPGDAESVYPATGTVPVPDCNGLLTNPCVSILRTAGFDTQIDRLTWGTAVVTKPADAVVSTQPAPATMLDLPATVTITTNPLEQDYPLVVPQPLPGETAQQYAVRLAERGITDAQIVVLPDSELDPSKGPSEVVSVEPEPGHRYNPAEPPSGEPTITANPPTAPPVAGGGSCGTPGVGSFDLSPLNVPIGETFPFGVFGWIGGTIEGWVSESSAPHWTFVLGENIDWEVNLSAIEPAMGIVRPVMLILSALGVVWMLAAAAMKIQGPQEE